MDEKTKKLLSELCTGWEVRVATLEVREVALVNAGNDTEANVVGMQCDTLRICADSLRQTMTDLRRMDNHEATIQKIITDSFR